MLIRLAINGGLIGLTMLGVMAAGEGIEGSAHDFSRQAWSQGELCLPCHVPHDAAAPQVAPLWDRSDTAANNYKLYDGTPGAPGLQSLLCLSCHDGSAAVDANGGRAGEVFVPDAGPQRPLIAAHRDLSSDHPIGVPYPDHDKNYRSRGEVEADGTVVLPEGRVECVSCHDVHNSFGLEKLLVKSNDRSALCLTCHRK